MIIYKATNKVNGKIYVGQTWQTLAKRISQHLKRSRNLKFQEYFMNAIRKWGIDGFAWEIIDLAHSLTQEQLDELEVWWIAFYDSTNRLKGYNCTSGGNGKKTVGEGTREKMREAWKKRLADGYVSPHKGRKKTKEQVTAQTASRKLSWTPELSQQISETLKRKYAEGMVNPRTGVACTEQDKKNISEGIKRKYRDEGYINPNSKKIQCIESGKIYQSCNAASEDILGSKKGHSNIGLCANGKLKTAYGYHWKFLEDQTCQ